VLSKEEFAAEGHRGTEQFGALHIQTGFGLHPLKFHRGLAAATLKRGAAAAMPSPGDVSALPL
jgi:hypothetical protein